MSSQIEGLRGHCRQSHEEVQQCHGPQATPTQGGPGGGWLHIPAGPRRRARRRRTPSTTLGIRQPAVAASGHATGSHAADSARILEALGFNVPPGRDHPTAVVVTPSSPQGVPAAALPPCPRSPLRRCNPPPWRRTSQASLAPIGICTGPSPPPSCTQPPLPTPPSAARCLPGPPGRPGAADGCGPGRDLAARRAHRVLRPARARSRRRRPCSVRCRPPAKPMTPLLGCGDPRPRRVHPRLGRAP